MVILILMVALLVTAFTIVYASYALLDYFEICSYASITIESEIFLQYNLYVHVPILQVSRTDYFLV